MVKKEMRKTLETGLPKKGGKMGWLGLLLAALVLVLVPAGDVCAKAGDNPLEAREETTAPGEQRETKDWKFTGWGHWYEEGQWRPGEGKAPETPEEGSSEEAATRPVVQTVSAGDISVQVEIKGTKEPGNLAASLEDVGGLYVFDISFQDDNGTPRKVEGVDALVRISGLAEAQVPDGIYYINEKGEKEDITACMISGGNGQVLFRTSHFSKYAILYAARVEASRVESAKASTGSGGESSTIVIPASTLEPAQTEAPPQVLAGEALSHAGGAPVTGESSITLWAWMCLVLSCLAIFFLYRKK